MSRPALLQVAPRFCADPTAGAEFRNLYLAAGLARQMDVTHIGFLPAAGGNDKPGRGRRDAENHRFVAVPREGSYRKPDLIRGIVGRVPFSVLNYTRSGMHDRIASLLREKTFDIVLFEGVHLGEYIPLVREAASRAVVVCDWHNIESEILERYSQRAVGLVRRLYARHAARKLAGYERWFVNQCDLHVTVSERDRQALLAYGARVPVVVIENGVPVDEFPLRAEGARRFRVVFTGAMDYHANVEAVTWFAKDVWPAIHAAFPQLVYTIVGRNPAPEVQALGGVEGIEVTGMVPDVKPYYRQALAAVMPLKVGGGTRIKILEAMAAGVPLISTAIGAEGLAATPGTHYVLADSSERMTAAVENLLRHPEGALRMANAGREFVRRNHDWTQLAGRLAEHLMTLRGETHAQAAAAGK